MGAPTAERTVYRSSINKSHQRKSWRDYPDRLLRSFPGLPNAASLHPGEALIEQYANGAEYAHAIIAAWAPATALASLIKVEATNG